MVGRPRSALSANGGRPVVTRVPSLSKSRYISGDQCRLRLWYDTYARDLATEPVFATGHEVGEMACRRYSGGDMVAHNDRVCWN